MMLLMNTVYLWSESTDGARPGFGQLNIFIIYRGSHELIFFPRSCDDSRHKKRWYKVKFVNLLYTSIRTSFSWLCPVNIKRLKIFHQENTYLVVTRNMVWKNQPTLKLYQYAFPYFRTHFVKLLDYYRTYHYYFGCPR